MSDGRIRILMVTTSLGGGAGLHVHQLAHYLDPERFDVRLAFAPGYPRDRWIEREGIPYTHMRWRRTLHPIATLQGAQDLLRLLEREPVDILHAHCSIAGVVGRLAAAWRRVPHTVFSVHALASRDYQPAWRRRAFLEIERGMDRFTDRYFVFTNALKNQLIVRGISRPDKIEVIPHGIEIPPAPGAGERERARQRLGLTNGELVVAAVGRLETQKGLVHLIRAFPGVVARVPSARLVLLGDGPLRASLEHEAAAQGLNGAVRFLGWREDVPELLPGMDLFCLPSLWETFGYVLLEAMACKVPIVASAVDSTPEVVGRGQHAVLVPPADPASLGDALVGLLADPDRRSALAAAGRRYMESSYGLSQMIHRYESAYAALAATERCAHGRSCAPGTATAPRSAEGEA